MTPSLALPLTCSKSGLTAPAPMSMSDELPVAWMWQHGETGNCGFIEHCSYADRKQWERMNKPRQIVCPLYAHPPVTAEPVALTDDMLRYAMAAMGTGSPREAQRLRDFWQFAMEAFSTSAENSISGERARPPASEPVTDAEVEAMCKDLAEFCSRTCDDAIALIRKLARRSA